jgi:hypothetical protein
MKEAKDFNERRKAFVSFVSNELNKGTKHNKKSLEKVAASYGIIDKTEIKEFTELAIVLKARTIALSPGQSTREKFRQIVDLYHSQVNLSHRTSHSMLLQQYSTPAPIGFLAGMFVNADENISVFEPSAGNGLLTIAADPSRVTVNEIDDLRRSNLEQQHYKQVLKQDATLSFKGFEKKFEAVITNSPFGILNRAIKYETFGINTLDHLMALRALDCMKDDGKAAIIIGGHTRWDRKGRIQLGKNRIFFNYLYSRYNVAAIINIDGHKLYSRQGTAFDVRLILVNGRKKNPSGAAPLQSPELDEVADSFEKLYQRVMAVTQSRTEVEENSVLIDIKRKQGKNLHYSIFQDTRNNQYVIEAYLKVNRGILHTTYRDDDLPNEKLITYYAGKGYFSRRPYRLGQIGDVSIHYPVIAVFVQYCKDNQYSPSEILKEAYPNEDYVTEEELNDNIREAEWQGVEYVQAWNKDSFSKLLSSIRYINHHPIAFLLEEKYAIKNTTMSMSSKEREAEALRRELEQLNFDDELGMPYTPASNSCTVLETVVPDSMGYETHSALQRVKDAVNGDIDEYVRIKLNYRTKIELCKALAAEQIDAVAMTIFNIEERGVGMIIGDQTGIGKGRIAASIIRYAVGQGLKPIFITEKANLFSDIYRDLVAIGSARLSPFIINGRESKTDIKNEDGDIVYQALPQAEQNRIFEEGRVSARFHFVVGTYSQFNSPDKKPLKPAFLRSIAADTIVIMDEAHNSSGSGNTGSFMQDALAYTKGVVFLSATFAKRPDNMPIYAMKTSIRDASMSRDELVQAISKGGVALQEILASQLVAEGQMIRRERSFEGVEVNYVTLDDKEQEHKAVADNITAIVRDIISFQSTYVDEAVEDLDNIAAKQGKQVTERGGTSQAGVDNLPYFSKVFNIINQMLFSIKAEAVADRAIARLKEGKKPIIAFSSTMGSFVEQMENSKGQPVGDGDVINADFSIVLQKGLDGILRYTETDMDGGKDFKSFALSELAPGASAEYDRINEQIAEASTGITISPIDVIVRKLTEAGYSVAEVTGRKFELQINPKNNQALVKTRKRINTNDAFRQFNNNEVDVLLINQSGSTGASAHAIVTSKVPKEEVKQRVMIVLQAELDINTEVQKRGRINRTGQIIKPIYDYVNSAIPAEKRLMMMLQKKLKSLDANTTSNQKSSTKILDVPDFLNKYGDTIVEEYLKENPEINLLLDDPLNITGEKSDSIRDEEAAHKVSGRVAVLSTTMQQNFYNEISNRYNEHVEYLKQTGEYDLEVEAMDLQAETISSRSVIVGKGGDSEFGQDTMLETVMANVLKKPFTKDELNNLITEASQGKDAKVQQREIIDEYEKFIRDGLELEVNENLEHHNKTIADLPNTRKLKKILEKEGEEAYNVALEEQTKKLQKELGESEATIKKEFNHRKQFLESILNAFYVGRNLYYTITTYDNGQELIPATFLGFVFDKKKKNPYAPSAMRLRFALASSNKYIALPASYGKDLHSIIGASVGLPHLSKEDLLTKWEDAIKESTVSRKLRHIYTGNVLQAFAGSSGKLVSFTTIDGETRKGILMPEFWKAPPEVQQKTVVPIIKALKIIRSLTIGANVTTKNGLSIFKQPGKFKLMVSSSRSKGGEVFLDPDILNLVDRNNFEKTSDKMVASLQEDKIEMLVNILQGKFNDSLSLKPSEYDIIKEGITKQGTKKKPFTMVIPKESVSQEKQARIRRLELEAMAVELELELLKFAA